MSVATAQGFVSPRSDEFLRELRDAFVEPKEKPLMSALAERFKIPIRTVYARAASERWHELRAARIQREEAQAGIGALVEQAAARTDKNLVQGFSDAIILALETITAVVVQISEQDTAPGTKINQLNTASFGILNLANSSKAIGLVSFERNLEKLGKEDNGRWNPSLLSQINLTINGMAAKVEQEAKAKAEKSTPEQPTVDLS
jgi:hypothetical protein